jgi:RNA polymerase sigma factor (sigma-70 family)
VSPFRTETDEELLRMTPQQPRAFDEFYVRHEALVLAYHRRRTASADLALDLTAETFVQALASVRRFRPGPQPAVAWLLAIAKHTLSKSMRRGRVADRARQRLGVARIAVEDADLDRIDRLGTLAVSELLAALPLDLARAVEARVLHDESYDAIATRLQCSPLVARKRVSRGLATLRGIVNEEVQ